MGQGNRPPFVTFRSEPQRRARYRRTMTDRTPESRDWLHASIASGEILHCDGEPLSLRADQANETLPTFEAMAYAGGIMSPNLAINWKGPVVVDLAGLESQDTNPVHRAHDENRPVAHTTTVANDGRRLVCSGVFSVASPDSQEILSGARNGFPWRPSVGLKLLNWKTVPEGVQVQINQQTFVGPLLWVTASVLKEISFVTIPGDPAATADIHASAANTGPDTMSFEDYVTSLGLDPASLSPELAMALQVAFAESMEPSDDAPADDSAPAASAAENTDPAPAPAADPQDPNAMAKAKASSPSPDLTAGIAKQVRDTIAAETARANSVRDLCAKFGSPTIIVGNKSVDLAAHAIRSGWDADRTELHARRHSDLEATRDARPHGPAVHSTSRSERNSLQAIQAGLLLRAGCDLDSKNFEHKFVRERLPSWLRANVNDPTRQKAMDQAQALRHCSLIDAMKLGLAASGHAVPHSREDVLQASFSTGVTANLFGATIGAKMLESYAEVKDFSEGWCSIGENPDLELHNRNRTQAAQSLGYHPPGGTAPHTGRSVTAEQAQVFRFTRQMSIDEADFLSDNFGKFKDTPRDFGLAAGRVRPDMVAAVLLTNGNLLATGRALFNTTDGNSVASGSALARATLSSLVAAIAKRKDGDANVNLPVTHLLVPPELIDTAVQLCFSAYLSNDSGSGEINPLKTYGIMPISEPRLTNGLVHPVTGAALAGSATQYYGVSAEARTIEVTYLEGAGQVPVVRTNNLVNGEFGINVDVRHYVGATPLDWRGFQRQNA